MVKLGDLFEIRYPSSLVFGHYKNAEGDIPFVTSKGTDNGIAGYVAPILKAALFPAKSITVPLKGTVFHACLQPKNFYCAHQIAVLLPVDGMSDNERLYYVLAIRANKYRFSYGRQADKTLRDINVPKMSDVPKWTHNLIVNLDGAELRATTRQVPSLAPSKWKLFPLSELFTIRKGQRLTKANMHPGLTPFIGASESNNGVTNYIDKSPIHLGNTITVPYNGNSVAEAFYQREPFWATDDVNVLYPKFGLSPAIGIFLTAIIRREKYRFSYGRKWHLGRMNDSLIKLPITGKGTPDFAFMENYIKTLPYSASI